MVSPFRLFHSRCFFIKSMSCCCDEVSLSHLFVYLFKQLAWHKHRLVLLLYWQVEEVVFHYHYVRMPAGGVLPQ